MAMPLLEVKDLKVYYYTTTGVVRAVDSIRFEVEAGDTFALAGESGCGKTTTVYSIMRLVPHPGRIVEGDILLRQRSLISMTEKEIAKVRWKEISMVFQGAMNALNPVIKVGEQIVEAIMAHETVKKSSASERSARLLEAVGLDQSTMNKYPHELSGGMQQRIVIAMALACNPSLLIADEPSTALDVIVQAQLLSVLRELQQRLGLSMILISHDLSVIAQICKTVGIMYAGKIMEYGDVFSIFKEPLHPYTKALMDAFPDIRGGHPGLTSIPGNPPNLINPSRGCRFCERCPSRKEVCYRMEPKMSEVKRKRMVACWLYSDS